MEMQCFDCSKLEVSVGMSEDNLNQDACWNQQLAVSIDWGEEDECID